jgi:hypothetical protein
MVSPGQTALLLAWRMQRECRVAEFDLAAAVQEDAEPD